MRKSNEQLQTDIETAIKWEPMLHAAEVEVTVKDGVVTLTGTVNTYAKKLEAETAAKNVAGVRALVENITVECAHSMRNDTDIARDAAASIEKNWMVPPERVKVKVEDGGITLSGEVAWNYQREAAKSALHNLEGVKWILNSITVSPEVTDKVEQSSIENALVRNGSVDEAEIRVSVSRNDVTLKGSVDSWYERSEAERTAWNTPGILSVKNELVIDYDYD